VIKINAHKEFSPPKLGLITGKQSQPEARLPGLAESKHGFTVIMIDNIKLSPLLRWV